MINKSPNGESIPISALFIDQVLTGTELCYVDLETLEEGLTRWTRANPLQQIRSNQVKMRTTLSYSIFNWCIRDWQARRRFIDHYEMYAHGRNDGADKFEELIDSFDLSKCKPITLRPEAGAYRVVDGVHRLAYLSEVLGWVDLPADMVRVARTGKGLSQASVLQPLSRLPGVHQLDRLVRAAYRKSHARWVLGQRGFDNKVSGIMPREVVLDRHSLADPTQDLVVLEYRRHCVQGYLPSPQSVGPINLRGGESSFDAETSFGSSSSRNRKRARKIPMQLGFERSLSEFLGVFAGQRIIVILIYGTGPELSRFIKYLVGQCRPVVIVVKGGSSAAKGVMDTINISESPSPANAIWPGQTIFFV